jgi:hypothetical protein
MEKGPRRPLIYVILNLRGKETMSKESKLFENLNIYSLAHLPYLLLVLLISCRCISKWFLFGFQ